MPKIWANTVDAHRQAVREATLDATAALVEERGLRSVTMLQIAENAGIGRATLYKYFPDIESILDAWHEREIAGHLEQLANARDRAVDPAGRLEAVLTEYARITSATHGHRETELAARLHCDQRVERAEHDLLRLVSELIVDAAAAGVVRSDIPPQELAIYTLNAIGGASDLPSRAAVGRLVSVTLAGIEKGANRPG